MGRKERKRSSLNAEVRELLQKEQWTDEEISFIREAYSGIGGLVGSQWDQGQFFTPAPIAEFVIKMMGIESGRVLEPSCGSGNFFRYIPVHCETVGVELMGEAARVASVCYPHVHIIQGNTLETQIAGEFDYCIGNPPFGLKVDFNFACGAKSLKSEAAFVEYGLRSLKDGGVLGLIVPDSILANQKEAVFRKWIMEHHRLLGVVSFPTTTFYHTGTGVKTSLLMIQKGRNHILNDDYSIFMAISEDIGWDHRGNPTTSDLDQIYEAYSSFEESHLKQKGIIKPNPIILPFIKPIEVVEAENGQFALAW